MRRAPHPTRRAPLMRSMRANYHWVLSPDAPRAQRDALRALEMAQFAYKLTKLLCNDALHSWYVEWVANEVKYLHIDSFFILLDP